MIDMHHIISDGKSHEILEKDFYKLLEGRDLEPIQLHYKDFSEWQNSPEQQERIKGQESYWLDKYSGEIPILDLPADYPRPAIQEYEGASLRFVLSKEETENIKAFAEVNDITLYMSILSIFTILLSKLSGQNDIIVGSPIVDRKHSDLENIVGIFLNTLAIRNEVKEDNTVKEFVARLRQNVLDAFENQEYQFEELVENISIGRDLSRNPLIDVMFNLLNHTEYEDVLAIEEVGSKYTEGNVKFDLYLRGWEQGSNIVLVFEYRKKLFNKETISKLIDYFKRVTEQVVSNQEEKISTISLLSLEDRKIKIEKFNEIIADPEIEEITIQEIIGRSFKNNPDKIAIKDENGEVSYKELQNRYMAIAMHISNMGIKEGSLIGVYSNDRVEVISIILGIIHARCVFVPLDANFPINRIMSMVEQVKLNWIISGKGMDLVFQQNHNNLTDTQFINLNNEIYDTNWKSGIKLEYLPSDPLYIYYTSGSTGIPKAILGKNNSLAHFIKWEISEFSICHTYNFSQLTNPGFDVFLRDIFAPLVAGGSICIPNEGIQLNGEKLIEWLEKSDVTLMHCVPSVFRQMNKVELNHGRINGLRYILLAGEKIIPFELKKWYEIFEERIQLVNIYGPTETTLAKSSYRIKPEDIFRQNIPVEPIQGSKFIVLDKYQNICPSGIPGEIYIRTPYRTLGYYGVEGLNKKSFIQNPFSEGIGDLVYKTGDIGKEVERGCIELLGRYDNQVKIRGIRIELGEIEKTLVNHENVKECVVLTREEREDKYLCAYLVLGQEQNSEALRNYLTGLLPDYMIPSYFVELEKIPLTSNGKVDRKALPAPDYKAGDDYVAPSNKIEKKLVEIWSEVLNIEKEEICVTANFFSIGGHSLKAANLTGKIHKEFGVEFLLRDVFIHTTIRFQAKQIENSNKKEFISIPKAKNQAYYSLSSAQKRMYLLQQMDLGSTAYNMPNVISLGKEVDKAKIEEVFRQLISRHESFRTSFGVEGEEPVQYIHERVDFKIEEFTIEKSEQKNTRTQFIKAFDLSKAPLLRVAMLEIKGEGYLLMVDMHHIISDGVSRTILEKEFLALYSGETLLPLPLQYKDYSEWQNSEEQQQKVKGQEDYWISKFAGEIPVLNLPTDYSRPSIQSHEGARVRFALNKEETNNIRALSESTGITLYMSVLSVFTILLSKLSGQEDIIIGTPIEGRRHTDLEHIVGMFVNTLAIGNEVKGEDTLREFIIKLKQSTLDTFENQEYQFEDLVEKVSVARDISRNPLFDVLFNLLNHREYSGDLSGLSTDEYVHTLGISKFDLTLTGVDYGEQLMFSISYCTKLFKPETIDRFISYFKQIIGQIPEKVEKNIYEIEIISELEKKELLYEFNETKREYPKDKTIHQLFEDQATRTPDSLAVVSGEGQITYSELNKKSNQIAQYLRNKGVGSNSVVSLFFDPSLEMLISFIGVLKSGAAYLPINTELPKDRVCYMILDSCSDILLTQGQISFESLPEIDITDVGDIIIKEDYDELKDKNYQFDSAYIIYTSGTTGKPKGVLLSHENLMNYFTWFNETSKLGVNDKTVLVTSYAFDLGYTGLYSSIISGCQLHLVSKELYLSSNTFVDYIIKNRISYLKLTSSLYTLLIDDDKFANAVNNLRLLVLGGEAINVDAVKTSLLLNDALQILNHYGPTEGTIGCISFEIHKNNINDYKNNPVIGRPINNTKVYVLNKYDHVQPFGVPGELCISGDGLAEGYINNPELTAEKFIEHPFKEGELLYKTGDLARWLPDGNIEFLGRIDHQVKIRGFRIELGEIENTLLRHENIKESVVLAREDYGDKYLCAYVVCKEEFNQEKIRNYLSAQLQDYMIPSYFVETESIPLNSNGKINRKALLVPEVKAGDDYVPPSNDVEEKLVKIWSEILNIPEREISIEDDFFKLGGHSLNVLRVVSAIKNQIGINLPLMHIYKASNIETIAIDILSKEFASNDFEVYNNESNNKVFCFPPIVGYGFCFAEVARLIPELCFYSFNYINTEDLVKFYADKIIEADNKGSYKLLGYSAGCKLVSLVAKELERRGMIVSDVILIDGYWNEKDLNKLKEVKENEIDSELEKFLFQIKESLKKMNMNFLIDETREKIIDYSRFISNINGFEIINAKVHLIQSQLEDEFKEEKLEKAYQMEQYTNDKLFIYSGNGEHSNMLDREFSEENVKIIRKCLSLVG